MKVIFAFIRAAFHNTYIYRLDFWARQISLLIMMYAMYSLWQVLYTQIPDAFGMDLQTMTTYGILGILLLPVMESASISQRYISEQVRMGTLELDLMKPLNFVFHMFSRCVGELGVWSLTHVSPGLILAVLFLDFSPPVNLGLHWSVPKWAFLGMILLAGLIIETCISWILGALSFWYGRSRSIYGVAMRFQLMIQQYPTFIRDLNRDLRVTVMLTTHDMLDIEKVCERMMIID